MPEDQDLKSRFWVETKKLDHWISGGLRNSGALRRLVLKGPKILSNCTNFKVDKLAFGAPRNELGAPQKSGPWSGRLKITMIIRYCHWCPIAFSRSHFAPRATFNLFYASHDKLRHLSGHMWPGGPRVGHPWFRRFSGLLSEDLIFCSKALRDNAILRFRRARSKFGKKVNSMTKKGSSKFGRGPKFSHAFKTQRPWSGRSTRSLLPLAFYCWTWSHLKSAFTRSHSIWYKLNIVSNFSVWVLQCFNKIIINLILNRFAAEWM